MFDCHRARVEEDQGDDEPEPPLHLAHSANDNASAANTGPKFAFGSCQWEMKAFQYDFPKKAIQ